MIDGGLRKTFHDRLKSGFHWNAIETGGTLSGVPDSNYCCNGVEGWVEFKKTDAWSVGITAEQSAWHQTRKMRGGRSFLAVRRYNEGGPRRGEPVDELWLCKGMYVPNVRRSGLRAPDVMWLGVWSGGAASWDWDEIRWILTQ